MMIRVVYYNCLLLFVCLLVCVALAWMLGLAGLFYVFELGFLGFVLLSLLVVFVSLFTAG